VFGVRFFNPTYSMAEADQAPHAAGAEEIAAQVNPPVQAPAQQAGEIQPAAGAQPVLQANEEENDMLRVMQRLEALENSQKASVESVLEELQHFIKMPMFNKEKALDYLINLKIVAKESNHPKSGFFNAVLQAMKDKIRVPDSQFQQYLQVLVGDKDHEKVLDSIAKVDKAMRVAAPRPFAARGRGRGGRASVRCFACNQFGHYQSYCPYRQTGNQAKKGRFSGGLQEHPKL